MDIDALKVITELRELLSLSQYELAVERAKTKQLQEELNKET